jgi:hypothetical protein
MKILIYSLLLLLVSGCCASKKQSTAARTVEIETIAEEIEIMEIALSISEDMNFDKKLYTFPRFRAEWRGKKIYVKLTYGGGCKQHDFQAFSSGKPGDEGFIDILVVDFTTDDRCRAFVNKDLLIDIENLKHTGHKIRVNGIEL